MKTDSSSTTGISVGSPGTGRPLASFLQEAPALPSPPGGVLFQEELSRSVQRQGGERQMEHRAAAVASRRAERHAGFGAERPAPATRPDADTTDEATIAGAPDGLAPVTATPPGGTEAAASETTALAPRTPDASAPSPSSQPTPPNTSPGAPAAALVEATQAARATSNATGAAANATAASASTSRPANAATPVQAFLDAARSRTASTPAAQGSEALSDPELLQRAEEILRQIRLNMTPGAQRVTLQLEPAELGKLWIRMTMRRGRVAALVRAERPETIAALEPRMDELRSLFREQGIEADSIELQLGFGGEQAEGGPSMERPAGELPHPGLPSTRTLPAFVPVGLETASPLRTPTDGVDTFA